LDLAQVTESKLALRLVGHASLVVPLGEGMGVSFHKVHLMRILALLLAFLWWVLLLVLLYLFESFGL
jgi:hypothetical protein